VYGPDIDEPVRMTRSGTNYYYHAAVLGTVTEITDGSGSVVERYTYDVYGEPQMWDGSGNAIGSSAIGNRLLFQGRDRDPDTSLYNFRNRYYTPGLGRFVQMDPIGKPHFEVIRTTSKTITNGSGRHGGFSEAGETSRHILPVQLAGGKRVYGFFHGPNLYTFGFNNSILMVDYMGLNATTTADCDELFPGKSPISRHANCVCQCCVDVGGTYAEYCLGPICWYDCGFDNPVDVIITAPVMLVCLCACLGELPIPR
jgi:RHS repeat-associated protein